MTVVYPLTAAERHTIREGLYETMADFERPWRMLLHLWMQYWTIVNALGDALTSYRLMTGGEFEGDRDPCGAYLEEAQRVEKSRRIDDCIDTVRKMICQSRTLSTAERDVFLERLHGGIMSKRDEDIMPALEELTSEIKASIDRKAE